MAGCGMRAIPSLGENLNRRLAEIADNLSEDEADTLSAAAEVETELTIWSDGVFHHYSENKREMKEVIASLALAAESVATRDDKYSAEIGVITGKLRSIAAQNSLGDIRRSVIESASALKDCVEKMAQESRKSVSSLSAQVDEYRERLRASERLSALDPLTELANRRAFETHLQRRVAAAKPFGLILIDIDEFKTINDKFGHLAGDDLLRQFASELRGQCAASDLVARWGGDEFAVLSDASRAQLTERMERVRGWVLGEYRIRVGNETVKTNLSASMGVAEWNGAETGPELMARADALVYSNKRVQRAENPAKLFKKVI